MSEDIAEFIARDKGISVEEVRMFRKLDLEEALRRYLSPELIQELIDDKKYFPKPENNFQRIINAGFFLSSIHKYAEQFCLTDEGRRWYESQFPSSAAVGVHATESAHNYYLALESRVQGTREKLRRVVFSG